MVQVPTKALVAAADVVVAAAAAVQGFQNKKHTIAVWIEMEKAFDESGRKVYYSKSSKLK